MIQISGSKPKKKPNAVRRIMERTESRERRARESSATVSSAAEPPAVAQTRIAKCPNKNCPMPRVRSGTCETCGAVAEEVNIVADIQFGEAANGAAVVQGNFLAADQGAIRSSGTGMAFRRVAGSGSEARERSIREVKGLLQEWTQVLRVPHHLIESGVRTYKMATNSNFVQGRRKINVAAICLYAVCRKESNNRVMLIDLADIIKTDVFLLGRDYKALLSQFPDMKEGTKPIILEDLIFRFASKLEFYHDTNKVAESAVRIAARMRKDNMTHGRRPAGICGAAIIMAARAHNYRRTVREVVYIAKVTMATLQERMEEFANVPSAQMTISEFHEQAFLESNHDPPFVYKQSKEWKDKHTRPRKRKAQDISQGDSDNQPAEPAAKTQQQDAHVQPRDVQPQHQDTPVSQQQGTPTIVDKDGFVVPPLPQRVPEVASIGQSIIASATGGVDDQLAALASEFGDSVDQEDEDDDEELDPSSELAMAAAQGIVPFPAKKGARQGDKADGDKEDGPPRAKRTKKARRQLVVNAEWEMDEENLEKEMEGHLNDPEMIGVSAAVQKDVEERAQQAAAAEDAATASAQGDAQQPQQPQPKPQTGPYSAYLENSNVSNDPIVHEYEFENDPEVMFCRLGEEEAKIKEIIWANHNKDYMRMVQQRIFASKMSEHGPPKQRRNRTKKPRIGEGQASPAGSAEEAAMNMMKTRNISTKLDYSRLGQVFDMSKRGPGSTYGGASSAGSQSALASVAGSDAGSDGEEEDITPAAASTAATAPSTTPTTAAPSSKTTLTAAEEEGEEEEVDEEDDYVANEDGYNEYTEYNEDYNGGDDFDPFADEYGGDDE